MKNRSMTSALGTKITIDFLRERRIDPEPLLKAAGLDATLTYNAKVRVPFSSQASLFELAAEATNDEFFGLRVAQNSNPLELGALSYISFASATFGDALANFRRYLRLVSDSDSLDLRSEGDRICVAAIPKSRAEQPGRQMIDCSKFYFIDFCRRLTGGRVTPAGARFQYDFSGDPGEHISLFGCPVSFGHDLGQIVFMESDLAAEIDTSDHLLHSALKMHCEALLLRAGPTFPELETTVRRGIAELLPLQKAKADLVAKDMGISERSLQRKLAADGTSFSEIYDNLRRDLAYQYLQETDESIAHIAFILGYSNQSSFNSSFKRLTGTTPGEVRGSIMKSKKS